MRAYISQLNDIHKRLAEVVLHLREQQSLMADIDCPRSHQALLMLLSNGLRIYCRLKNQQQGLLEKVAEQLPLRRQ
jgi:hypothetical protein